MRLKLFIGIITLLLSHLSFAQEGAISSSCQKPGDKNKLFWCLVKNKPEVRLQEIDVKVHDNAISEAAQMLNPELELESIDNKAGGLTSEVTLKHTFELGGKRGSREQVAMAEKGISETRHLAELEEASREFAVKIYRLRQINTELELATEKLETFRGIQRQYKKLGRLNPEQSVSVSVFEIAEQETELKKEALSQEKNQILSEFQSILGNGFALNEKLLPNLRSDWPNISVDEIKNSTHLNLKNEVDLASAKYGLAKSESWPDLSIGPKIEQTTGDVNETTFGVALSMPLPILNLNGGGRAKASSELQKAELQRKLISNRQEQYKNFLLNSYLSSSKIVQKSVKRANIQKRHKNLHTLLNRGVVNSALVIEMHREVFEFYEGLHEHELKAIDALWRLYALKGTLLKEEI